MRKVGVESKANSGSRAERPRWADMRILMVIWMLSN